GRAGRDHRRRPASRRTLDESEHDAAQPERDGDGSGDVDRPAQGPLALRHEASRGPDRQNRDRRTDEEDRAPRHGANQPTPQNRSEHGCETGEPGPRTDRAPAIARRERRLDEREARGYEQGRADTLGHAGDDETEDAGDGAARDRRRGEERDAQLEDPPPPEA